MKKIYNFFVNLLMSFRYYYYYAKYIFLFFKIFKQFSNNVKKIDKFKRILKN